MFSDGKYKTVNLVDTAGSMEFPAMRELRIRSATAIIIVYNVTDTGSIVMASTLKKQVQQMRGNYCHQYKYNTSHAVSYCIQKFIAITFIYELRE